MYSHNIKARILIASKRRLQARYQSVDCLVFHFWVHLDAPQYVRFSWPACADMPLAEPIWNRYRIWSSRSQIKVFSVGRTWESCNTSKTCGDGHHRLRTFAFGTLQELLRRFKVTHKQLLMCYLVNIRSTYPWVETRNPHSQVVLGSRKWRSHHDAKFPYCQAECQCWPSAKGPCWRPSWMQLLGAFALALPNVDKTCEDHVIWIKILHNYIRPTAGHGFSLMTRILQRWRAT